MYSSFSHLPSHIIHFNPQISLFDHLCSKYTSYSSPLFIPFFFQHSMNYWYDKYIDKTHKTSFAIIENTLKNSSDANDIFLNLPTKLNQKRILKLDGVGIASLICNTNQTILKKFFNSFLSQDNDQMVVTSL